jgi:uncharacterized membrane protein
VKIAGWQARCFDIVIVLSLSALLIYPVLYKVVQYYDFQIHDWDTGIYSNVIWNLANGNGFHSALLGGNDLGEHFSPIIAVFVPFFMIDPSPIWLLAGQGLAVGATYVLLYFAAVKIFGDANLRFVRPLALVFAIWALVYRPLWFALLFEFHPSTLATPLLAGALLALMYGRDRVLWCLVAVLLLSKENAPLAVLGLGCYAGLVRLRPRLGLALGAIAAVSAALIFGVVIPSFRTTVWTHYARFGPLVDWPQKSFYLYELIRPLAFLPLAFWRALICALPLVALNLSVNFAGQFSARAQYDDFASVFLLVAAMHGAVVVFRAVGSVLKGWRATVAYGVVALVAVLLATLKEHDVYELSDLRAIWPGQKEWQLRQELAHFSSLPREIGIAAQQVLGPYLSARPRYVPIPDAVTGLDLRRLRSGDEVLITPIGDPNTFSELAKQFNRAPNLALIHSSPVLRVYEVR